MRRGWRALSLPTSPQATREDDERREDYDGNNHGWRNDAREIAVVAGVVKSNVSGNSTGHATGPKNQKINVP